MGGTVRENIDSLQRLNTDRPYRDLVSCARYIVSLPSTSHIPPWLVVDFLKYASRKEEAQLLLSRQSPELKREMYVLTSRIWVNPPGKQVEPVVLTWLWESVLKSIFILDKNTADTEKLRFIETACQKNPENPYLQSAFQKIMAHIHKDFYDKFSIAEHSSFEELIPVLTHVGGMEYGKSINSALSYATQLSKDYHKGVLLPVKISLDTELRCMLILARFLHVYAKVEKYDRVLIDGLVEKVYDFIKTFPEENLRFLKKRIHAICDNTDVHAIWKRFDNASYYQAIVDYIDGLLNTRQLKAMCDFCTLFLSLVVWYGGGGLTQQKTQNTLQNLRNKYKGEKFIRKIALTMLPIDFAFVRQSRLSLGKYSEHKAILKAMKAVSKNTKVQAPVESFVWSRDVFAWLDIAFQYSVHPVLPHSGMACGLLNEGGNVIPGTGLTKFILVSEEAMGSESALVALSMEARTYDISVYSLPAGFAWVRNTRTRQDVVLRLAHIDTVINVVPASCTVDNRMRVIIDPYYYKVIKERAEFKRFLKEQAVSSSDIVLIDKRELYLNLSNFSIIMDKNRTMQLLFNKDKGYTIPRLNLKPKVTTQPAIEIINLSAFSGSLRCVTNMVPESALNRGTSVQVTFEATLPAAFEDDSIRLFFGKRNLLKALSLVWISSLYIRYRPRRGSAVFDVLGRTLFITLGIDEARDAKSAVAFIERNIVRHCTQVARKMGIPLTLAELDNYVVTPLAHIPQLPDSGYYLKTRAGKLLRIDMPLPVEEPSVNTASILRSHS